MAAYENKSGGLFILPDGTEVPSGATVEISDDVAAIPGVAQMIEAGKLSEPEPEPEPARAKK